MVEYSGALVVLKDRMFEGMFLYYLALLWNEKHQRYEDIIHSQVAEVTRLH
jgi:hypothetical protein